MVPDSKRDIRDGTDVVGLLSLGTCKASDLASLLQWTHISLFPLKTPVPTRIYHWGLGLKGSEYDYASLIEFSGLIIQS